MKKRPRQVDPLWRPVVESWLIPFAYLLGYRGEIEAAAAFLAISMVACALGLFVG